MDIKIAPLTPAVEGLKRAEAKVVEAASAIARTGTGEVAPREDDAVEISDEALVSDAVRGAVIPAGDDDLAAPLVDLLQAKTAYKAAAVAVKVTADVEDVAARMLTDRKV